MPVVLDCKALVISTPSFLDEVVKVVLVDRGADALDLVDANDRTRTHVMRAATNRGVAGKVRVGLRMPT